jgi:UDP-glucose 4-epimerase
MKILVTGASGFVGGHLTNLLTEKGIEWVAYDRTRDLPKSFEGFTTIIHLAAKVHDMNYPTIDAFLPGNVELTKKLINRAIQDKVPHFIFLSSIKVNGEERDEPYFEIDVPAPKDPYGLSKWMAENIIKEATHKNATNISYTIIRPPLIFGEGVKGNFELLQKIAKIPLPLPLGGIQNKRSFIDVNNLAELLINCAKSKDSYKNKTLLANDGNNYSTSELLIKFGKNPKMLFYVPKSWFKFFFKLIGKGHYYSKVFESLEIDQKNQRKIT